MGAQTDDRSVPLGKNIIRFFVSTFFDKFKDNTAISNFMQSQTIIIPIFMQKRVDRTPFFMYNKNEMKRAKEKNDAEKENI